MKTTPTFELATLAAREDLLDTLVAWFEAEWPDHFATVDAETYLRSQMNDDELPIALVILADGEVAGTVALKEDSIEARPDLGPWIAGLLVHPDHRGHGVGQLLVASASRVAWAMGHETVYTGTQVPELFTQLGWEVTGEAEQSGEPVTLLAGRKPDEPPSYYDEIGGEPTVRALVDRFYDLMDELDVQELRDMHARSLKSSRRKLFEFLSGWLGGPQLYIEKHGHPRLRMRHMPFSIGTEARDQWLRCMDQALDEVLEESAVREQIRESFVQMADHMRNRPGP